MIKVKLRDGTEGKLDENNLYVEFSKNVFTKIKIEDINGITLRENNDLLLNDYEIKRIGNLSLCRKTFKNRESTDLDIEISQWSDDMKYRWTISSFEKSEKFFNIISIEDRILDPKVNANDYMKLVKLGFEWLKDHLNVNK